jgi:hypothetical protein
MVVARVRRKVDAAGTAPLPPVSVGKVTVAVVSAQPAPAAMPDTSSSPGVAQKGGRSPGPEMESRQTDYRQKSRELFPSAANW